MKYPLYWKIEREYYIILSVPLRGSMRLFSNNVGEDGRVRADDIE
jgi:hypothetical protein